jgi:hypothetical protein
MPIKITVEGAGPFPDDMLRYDRAVFESRAQELKSRMRGRRQVVVICEDAPTEARWESFLWYVKEAKALNKFWTGTAPKMDSFGHGLVEDFIDGRSKAGTWGIYTPDNWDFHGCGKLGEGCGQRYRKLKSGKWLKVEG